MGSKLLIKSQFEFDLDWILAGGRLDCMRLLENGLFINSIDYCGNVIKFRLEVLSMLMYF